MKFFTNYFPLILAGVIAVEQQIPNAPGKTKEQVVLDSIGAAAVVGEQAPSPKVDFFSAMIAAIVSSFNTSGFFTHKAAAVAPAANANHA